MRSISKHLPHYFALIFILVIGGIGFALFSYDRIFQMAIAITVAIAYVCWGVVHHSIHGDLHFSVVIEYLVVSTLGLVIIFSLLLRA